jgi:membrane protein YqaA with SNARE-associated domain
METLLDPGYWGMFLSAFLAATILPFSSDVIYAIMLLGNYDPFWTTVMASLGNWLGGMSSYALGYLGYWLWIDKYLGVAPVNIEKWMLRLQKFGPWPALLSWLPVVGDPIAIALGFLKLNPYAIAGLMLLGKTLRYVTIGMLILYFPEMRDYFLS